MLTTPSTVGAGTLVQRASRAQMTHTLRDYAGGGPKLERFAKRAVCFLNLLIRRTLHPELEAETHRAVDSQVVRANPTVKPISVWLIDGVLIGHLLAQGRLALPATVAHFLSRQRWAGYRMLRVR